MSIKSQIERIEQNVSDTYDALEEVGADMPSTRNTANLAATARTIKPVFTITATEGDGELTDVSATFAEMYEAHQAGKLLVLVASSPYTDAATLLQCEHVTADNIIFSTLSTIGGENGSYSANIFSDDTNVYQWVEISGGVDEETLNAAVEAALTEAKASGEFDGADGERGTGILSTTTGIASYTTTVNGVKPTYRILLSTLKTQAGVDKVLIGDSVRYSTFLYPIITLDSEYAYMGARISLQGSAGASSEWYTGTGITGTSTTATIFSGSGVSSATVGDMYLNTSTYNTYRCTTAGAASAAKWVYVCNIKGTSVTVSKVTESTASGGTNVVTFSDGTTLNVKNGKDGADGAAEETIPMYHISETERVIERILTLKQNHPNHIVFGTISDNHVNLNNAEVMRSARHAAYALESIASVCDFIANLGDNVVGNAGIDTDSDYANALYMANATKEAFTKYTSYNLVGNHDKSASTARLFNLYGKYNKFDNHGTMQIRGYGYKDYESKKVRVITLNTGDYWNRIGGNGMSYEQKDFFMKALDLSAKTDYEDWTIIVLSHIPLDYLGGDFNKGADLKAILKAYDSGESVSITVNSSYASQQNESDKYSGTLTYNYSGKNTPKVVNIHGHIHNNKVGNLKFIDDNTELSMMRIATPNSTFVGNESTDRYTDYGDYSITKEEAAKIAKVANTAADTSATFYLFDLDEQTVYAVGYGADIDRTISYSGSPVVYIPHWDIGDRTAVQLDALATANKSLNRSNYYYGVTGAGVFDKDVITACTVSGNDVTFTSTTKNYGIGVPYQLEAGASYTFSAKASVTGRLRKMECDANGVFVSGSEKYSSSGTDLSVTFDAPNDATRWVVLIVDCYTANTSVTYSNVALTKN